jgi:hypothetical protein
MDLKPLFLALATLVIVSFVTLACAEDSIDEFSLKNQDPLIARFKTQAKYRAARKVVLQHEKKKFALLDCL